MLCISPKSMMVARMKSKDYKKLAKVYVGSRLFERLPLFDLIGWVCLFGIFTATIMIWVALDREQVLAGLCVNYFFSFAMFVNLAFRVKRNWPQLRLLTPTQSIRAIYQNASPNFLFFGNIPRREITSGMLGVLCFSYILVPSFLYWKVAFPESAPSAPLFLVAPIFIHLQLSSTFEFLVINALKSF